MSYLLILLLALVPVGMALAHTDCAACHSNMGGGLNQSVENLCSGCHAGHQGSGNHQTGLILPAAMQTTLPLVNRKMTCVTCHDPHQVKEGGLRMPPNQLCNQCHPK